MPRVQRWAGGCAAARRNKIRESQVITTTFITGSRARLCVSPRRSRRLFRHSTPRAMSQFGPRPGPGGKRRGFSKETEAFLRGETPAATAHEPSSRDENSSASPGQRPFCPARFSTNRPVRSAEPLTSNDTHPRATHRDVGGERRVQADRRGPPRHRFGGTRASKGAWISSQEPGRRRRPGRGQTPTGSRAAGSARVRDTNEGRDRGGEPARAGAVDGPGRPAGAR